MRLSDFGRAALFGVAVLLPPPSNAQDAVADFYRGRQVTITVSTSPGGINNAVQYQGIIDEEHTAMSGSWHLGNGQGTFSANSANAEEGATP